MAKEYSKKLYEDLKKLETANAMQLFKLGYKQGANPKNEGANALKIYGSRTDRYGSVELCIGHANSGDMFAKGIIEGMAERYLKYNNASKALELYNQLHTISKSKLARILKIVGKKPLENKGMFQRIRNEIIYLKAKEEQSKTIDAIVTSIMAITGIGVLYMLFSKQQAGIASSQLLAPPFQNYWIYVFPVIFIAGAIYFLWKKAHIDFRQFKG